MRIRKKLTTTIITQLVTILAAWLASKGLEAGPEVQAFLIGIAMLVVGIIQGTYNIGQGIADKGKETLLVFLMVSALIISPIMGNTWLMAQDANSPPVTCCDDYEACEELLTECADNNSDCDDSTAACRAELEACDDCGFKTIILDKKIQAAIITILIAVIGYSIAAIAPPDN